MSNAKHNILANTFSLTNDQRSWCTVCKLIYFPGINYVEMRRQVAQWGFSHFLWNNSSILRGRVMAAQVAFPDLPSMKDRQAMEKATLICSLREYEGCSYAVFAPMYVPAKEAHKFLTVSCSLEALLGNNFCTIADCVGSGGIFQRA